VNAAGKKASTALNLPLNCLSSTFREVTQLIVRFPQRASTSRVAKGGHFAPWEQPTIFAEEVRTGFRSLRN
jgi:pimeloyl-ACP methyl ester carboxylesterase